MNYSKDDIKFFHNNVNHYNININIHTENERIINNKVNSLTNKIISYIPGNNKKQLNLTLYKTDRTEYAFREEIFRRLKLIFPTMKVSSSYLVQNTQEYFDIHLDWSDNI